MTETTREGHWGLLMGRKRESTNAAQAVPLGPYTYLPAPVHSSATVNGVLTRGDCPVALKVTEPLLRNFLDVMSTLEADLARRWVGSEARSARPGAEQPTA
ncbi:hypothetical protein [Streptomyces thermoalcalitolerans]|uniref:Uncharacterized protein n=1 Tax=Streptomyces thermoalcalitolerans TaxID=65605 RepID=A0ABN1PKH8_9ACTN